jgi:hypothetical protein
MCCQSAELEGGVILHVCRTDGETRPVKRRRRNWWCFKCRKRALHRLMGFYPSGLSYYGPNFWWECPTCKEEHIAFPGFDPPRWGTKWD